MTEPTDAEFYAALPEPLEIDWPDLNAHALGCGVEDRGLHGRYECAEYGWQDGVDKCAERVPEQIFDADQLHAFADATHTLRAESLDRARIRDIFMAHGFTVKDGQTDLKQYVYDAADALLAATRPAPPAMDGGEDAAPIDNCTDPYNCKRCKAHPNHRAGLEHAGIPAARAAQKEGEKP